MTPIISVEDILGLNSSNIHFIGGSRQAKARQISSADNLTAGNLAFVSTAEDLKEALQASLSIIVAARKAMTFEFSVATHQCVLAADSINEAMVAILPFWDDKDRRTPKGISPLASVAKSAQIGRDVSIGAFAFIGEDAIIGDGCVVSSHVSIERGAEVHDESYLHPMVTIGARCRVGKRCEIHSGTVIGSDGYGYWSSKDLKHHKIPQVGIVVLEDDVEIGANCAIDRATLSETRIGQGTKFDNLIHFAHNCSVGKNSRITAGFMTAGSTHIGDNFLTGGVCQVADHITITDNVSLAGRSGVTKDIEKGGAYGGYPLEPLKDAMKTIANLGHLSLMRKQLHQIRKHLGLLDKE